MLNIKTFKKLCLKSRTEKADEIHEYYIKLCLKVKILNNMLDNNNMDNRFILLLVLLILSVVKFYISQHTALKLRRIVPYIKPGDTILDLGCGDCCLLTENKSINVISLDVMNKAKCRTPILYDGYKIPLLDKSVDVTVCAFVLHHVPHFKDTIKGDETCYKR